MNTDRPYIHALRFASLNGLYDLAVALTSRENTFKSALLDNAGLAPGQRVLDVGCGTGTLACMAARRVPELELHGLDGDPAILQRARRKALRQDAQVAFVPALSTSLPFPDGHFDQVVSTLFFHHLLAADKQCTLAEILRVLKPGGRLHIGDWGAAQDPLMRAAFLVIQLIDGFRSTGDNVRGELPGMLESAGFTGVRVDRRLRSMLGTLEILRAEKPAGHLHLHA